MEALRDTPDDIAAGEETLLSDLRALLGFDKAYSPGEDYPRLAHRAEARLAMQGFRCRRVEGAGA